MGIFTKLFGGADGIRETMQDSYEKHYRLAQGGNVPPETSPHEAGLYGALGSRYEARGEPRSEPVLWQELLPFLLMGRNESVEALAEYVVLQEMPDDANAHLLANQINAALHSLPDAEEHFQEMADYRLGFSLDWAQLLDSQSVEILTIQSDDD